MPGWVGSRAGAVRKAPVSIPRPFDGAYRFPVRPSRAGFLPSAYSGDREGGSMIRWAGRAIATWVKPRADLIAENLCLRQQLIVLQRRAPRPRLRDGDRRFFS
jgi:hypothetical protein